MSSLKQLVLEDLARQYVLEGRPVRHPCLFGALRRLLHPRFLPILLCRASRASFLHGVPVLPEFFTYLNLALFGIEITPRCEIGPGIYFPHTAGTVIGARRLGRNVTVFQGVTLGAKRLDMHYDPARRPEVGDNVILGAGAKVLGGVRIGNNVVVGANSVVTHSVAPDTKLASPGAESDDYQESS
jgi:serine O-acetyltransferase